MSHYGIRAVDRSCGSYGPGHLMHWIQAKKSHEDAQPIIKVKVVAVDDDGPVEIEGHDLKLTLWYHDPDHLRSALWLGGRAGWRPKYHVLYVISGGSFNLATLNQVQPCKPPIRRRPTETSSLDFSCGLAGSGGGGAGWLVGLIAAGGYDRSSGVAPVGRAFLGPVGVFVSSGQGRGPGVR
jgi:hypothetical protein